LPCCVRLLKFYNEAFDPSQPAQLTDIRKATYRVMGSSKEGQPISSGVTRDKFVAVLVEVRARKGLVQGFRWDFSMLCTDPSSTLSEEQVWDLFKASIKGYTKEKYEAWRVGRRFPGRVAFEEIEHILLGEEPFAEDEEDDDIAMAKK
jgi:hypothetical protein